MDRASAIDTLAERCRTDSGTILSELLARLGGRTVALAAALGGDPLRFEVTAAGTELQGEWVTVTSHGHVAVVNEQSLAGQEYRPDVVMSGTPDELLAVVLDDDGPHVNKSAVCTAPGLSVERVRGVLDVVAEELLAMAAADG